MTNNVVYASRWRFNGLFLLFHTIVVNSSVDTLSACINDFRCTCVYITTKKRLRSLSKVFTKFWIDWRIGIYRKVSKRIVTFTSCYCAEGYHQSQKASTALKKIYLSHWIGRFTILSKMKNKCRFQHKLWKTLVCCNVRKWEQKIEGE